MIDRGSWIILGLTSALRLAVGVWQSPLTAGAGGVPNGADAVAVLCGLATGIALVRTASGIDGARCFTPVREGIAWTGHGSSNWSSVSIRAARNAWYSS